jgi:signal transduction histidine kinase
VNDKFKLNVFRIIQEQLNNILKHAEATKVIIKLLQSKKSIRLVISDNGTGFNAQKKQKGIGIANITSRVSAYNGVTDFDSQPGHGCILTAIFPVTAELLCK